MSYIEKETAVEKIQHKIDGLFGGAIAEGMFRAINELNDLPTVDAVKVVRCEDCKHCEVFDDKFGDIHFFCKYHANIYRVHKHHYCGYGKRKNDL